MLDREGVMMIWAESLPRARWLQCTRSSRNKCEAKSNPTKSDSQSGIGSLQSKQKNHNSSSTQSKGSTSKQKDPTPNLSPKLGKDGKLTPQEHQHHLNN